MDDSLIVLLLFAPNSEVSIYPWKDSKEHIQQTVQHVREFLRKYRPVTAAR